MAESAPVQVVPDLIASRYGFIVTYHGNLDGARETVYLHTRMDKSADIKKSGPIHGTLDMDGEVSLPEKIA